MIQDILTYSKLVPNQFELERLDPAQLVRELIHSYPNLQSAEILIREPLLHVRANKAALTQVVSNLLGNAVKFVAPGVQPRIVIRSEARGDFVRLWFEDNGIGIPKSAQGRIFQIFQRLHAPAEYEGTGIGLAIVEKATHRMGGRVGVESEAGQGSRFWVELLKDPAPEDVPSAHSDGVPARGPEKMGIHP